MTCYTRRQAGYEKGFTLMELMIVVAILGIIAAVALPAYQDSVAKARRSDAQGALTSFANAMERYYTTNSTYTGAASAGADTGAPTIFSTTAPLDGGSVFYNLTISAATDSTYTLRATAVNGQAGDGNLELDNTGARRWDRGNDGFDDGTDDCWKTTC